MAANPGTGRPGWHSAGRRGSKRQPRVRRALGASAVAVGLVAGLAAPAAGVARSGPQRPPGPGESPVIARMPLPPGLLPGLRAPGLLSGRWGAGMLPGQWGPGLFPGRWGRGLFHGRWAPGLPSGGVWPAPGQLAGTPVAPRSPWRVQPAPDQALANGTLTADSCVGATVCTAVGDYENRFGTELTLAERWNGTRWAVQPTPSPAGAAWSSLFGVSCASARSCMAVGYYATVAGRLLAFAERWTGTGWTIQRVPGPAGSLDSGLFGVSCPAVRACVAAGVSLTRARVLVTLAEAWNGTSWRAEPTPNPPGSSLSELAAVSCSSPGACTAAGNYDLSTGQSAALAERWNGTRWAIQATPSPAGTLGTGLSAVSCSSALACTAVGSSLSADTGAPVLLAEAWDGRAWRIQATPQPTGPVGAFPGSVFSAVSCASPGACTAVGWYINKTVQQVPLAEHWNGTRWAIQATPDPARSQGTGLSAISCTAPGACTAAGAFAAVVPPAVIPGVALPNQALAEAWRGTRWAIQPTPNRIGAAIFSGLSDVSCTSVRACTAAGSSIDIAGSVVPQAVRWDGTRWAIQPAPRPARALDTMLNGVSCATPRACTAVGTYISRGLVGRALAERWNGTRWAIQPTPHLGGAALAALFAVSCASPRACTAVGRAGKDVTLAERWNGTRWIVQPTPHRVAASGAELSGVSCTSPWSCTAVGEYRAKTGERTLAERWNGTRWAIQPTPSPAGTATALLSGVSCTSPRACTAVGEYVDRAGGRRTLAERWNGTRWAIQPTPNRAAGGELSDVSCASARSCTAAGGYFLSNGAILMLAEAWHGTRWKLQASPRIAGYDSGLSGVSCTAPGACTAVGFYDGLSGISLNLAIASAPRPA